MEHQAEHPATRPSGTPPGHAPAAYQSPDFAEALAKGYEPHDLTLRPVFVFIAGLSVTLVVVLAVIYSIMMALAAYDRSGDATPSPVAVKLPAPYAPLQPSLGIYENHENDHDLLDWQDMDAMRYKTQVALSTEKIENGRHQIPIETAMNRVLPMLVIRPTTQPVAMATDKVKLEPAPAGSYEGFINESDPKYKVPKIDPSLHPNDLNRLNNLGN